ncbi:hypothetical protein TNCV_770301 [Trichonephila clavipes]|nr:hypothetical protein TNCV_770301 [Trichonephila clavipes]
MPAAIHKLRSVMSDITVLPGYFPDDKKIHLAPDQLVCRITDDDEPNLFSCGGTFSPVQSTMLTTPLQTGSTVSGQWDTHKQVSPIVPSPQNVWQQFFGRSVSLRQQETDFTPR